MFKIHEVIKNEQKSILCNDILRGLPDWFGIEEAIVDYANTIRDMPFYAAYAGDKAIGFAAIKVHNTFTAEIYVMGISAEYHRNGIGKLLIERCEQYCMENGKEFLTVKTLAGLNSNAHYAKTRHFYEAMGFKPLEVFKTLWDEHNPCLFLVKNIGCGATKVKQFVKLHNIEAKVEVRLLDLVSEIGELSKEVLKGSGYGTKQLELTKSWEEELGDVYFSLTCIANSTGINLENALESVIKKYGERFAQKGNMGSGL